VFHHIVSEGGVIRRAPVAFLTVVGVVTIGVWLIFSWGYGREIETLQAQAALMSLQRDFVTDQLAEIREQLRELQAASQESGKQ
jgi:hypothetical protein